jgi:hypothetical protein
MNLIKIGFNSLNFTLKIFDHFLIGLLIMFFFLEQNENLFGLILQNSQSLFHFGFLLHKFYHSF